MIIFDVKKKLFPWCIFFFSFLGPLTCVGGYPDFIVEQSINIIKLFICWIPKSVQKDLKTAQDCWNPHPQNKLQFIILIVSKGKLNHGIVCQNSELPETYNLYMIFIYTVKHYYLHIYIYICMVCNIFMFTIKRFQLYLETNNFISNLYIIWI